MRSYDGKAVDDSARSSIQAEGVPVKIVIDRVRDWFRRDQPDLLRIAWLARYEASSAWVDLRGRFSPRQRALLKQLRSQRGLKLHIASGPSKKEGWVNVDGAADADVQVDLRRPLPLASDSVAMMFSEHFVDHLQFPDVVGRFLGECYRILEPGGRLRIVVHDAELVARAYLKRDEEFFRIAMGGAPPLIETVNNIFRFNGFHQFIYDFEALGMVLRRAGFDAVVRSSFRGSEVPELNLDCDEPDRELQSLYVEGIKSPGRDARSSQT